MRKRKPKPTLRTLRRAHAAELDTVRRELATALVRIQQLAGLVNRYKKWIAQDRAAERAQRAQERQLSQQEKALEWETYDRAQAALTQAEVELFKASPAYQKYQQFRATHAQVRKGDWRAP